MSKILVSVDDKLLARIDRAARAAGMSRSAYLAGLAARDLGADRGLDGLLFEVAEPGLQAVASWVARGLTAYDAVYVALAEERGEPLVTDDSSVLAIAGDVARPLMGGSGPNA